MLTIKKGRNTLQILAVILVAGLTGCGPRGPRDLHKGERLIASARFADAVPVLTEAVQLLGGAPTVVQARAWNLLGLAYHGAGQPDAAGRAYLQALKLDRNLWAADYNLGCLQLEETNFAGAIDYLTTYTTSHTKDVNGYLMLGRARLKFALDERPSAEKNRQLDNARLDYEYAEQLKPSSEACNALGLIELQGRRPSPEQVKASLDYFRRALQRDPHYAPALLNLAILLQRNNPREALDSYRQYLDLQPPPPQAREVERIAHQLDLDLRITMTPVKPEHPSPATAVLTTAPASPTTPPPARPAPAPVVEKSAPKPSPQQIAKTTPTVEPPSAPEIPEQTQPVVQPQRVPVVPKAQAVSAPANTSVATTPATSPVVSLPPEKKSFAQKLNPINWFSGKTKKPDISETPVPAEPGSTDRYTYPLPVTPIPGDRKLAKQLTEAGRQAEQQSNHGEAMQDYQEALKADPTYFEPGLALGLAAIDAKDYPTALDALGQALAINGNSADARYAFSWVLGKRGYYQDAANELDKLLASHPKEVRAHLLLGNFYADNLDQPKLARDQYLKALDLINPQSTQAAVLRAWLDQHP